MMGRGPGGGPGGFPGGGGDFGAPYMHPGLGRGFFPYHALPMMFLMLAALVALGVAGWYLFRKAGYEGALGLLLAIPGVNVVALLFLALADWPVLRELRDRRDAMGDAPMPAYPAFHGYVPNDAVVYPGVTAPMAAAAAPEAPTEPMKPAEPGNRPAE